MEETELKLGNYILDVENEVRQVMELSRGLIRTSCDRILLTSQVKPIPLSKEILLKCGFDSAEYNDYRHPVLIGTLTLYEGVAELHISDLYSVWVNNLHQLQNLFYCLCGEELEVNL